MFGNRLAGGGPRSGSGFVDAIFRCRKPSIAAINGPAVGIGITMTLPMDVRIAAKGAKIVNLGADFSAEARAFASFLENDSKRFPGEGHQRRAVNTRGERKN